MRFKGKTVFLGAAMLSAALAFNRPPMQDAYAKGKSATAPKYEPLNLKGTGELAKLLKKARNIPPKDYNLGMIQEAVENGKHLVKGMKINEKGTFVFNVAAVKLKNGKTLTANVKIEDKEKIEKKLENKKKDPLWRITFYTTHGKGYWATGIPFITLAKRYEEKTKETLQYVAFGMKKKANGNIDFYIIPVETFEDAKEGRIRAGVPFLVIPYRADKDNFASSFGRNVHNIVEGGKDEKEDDKE